MKPDWAREVRDQCIAQGVAFFFKQWSGVHVKALGRLLDGREWSQFPYEHPAIPALPAMAVAAE